MLFEQDIKVDFNQAKEVCEAINSELARNQAGWRVRLPSAAEPYYEIYGVVSRGSGIQQDGIIMWADDGKAYRFNLKPDIVTTQALGESNGHEYNAIISKPNWDITPLGELDEAYVLCYPEPYPLPTDTPSEYEM